MRKRDTWEIIKNKNEKIPSEPILETKPKKCNEKNEHMTYTLSFRLFHFLYSRDFRV